MTDELLKEINKKLDILIALAATQGLETDNKIKILRGLKFSNYDIAKYTGISEPMVRHRLKKTKG